MKIKNNPLIPLCGIGAIFGGILNGIIGTGSGIVYTFLFSLLYSNVEEYEKKDIFASCLISTLPVCVMSFAAYVKENTSLFSYSFPLFPVASLGGAIGGLLLNKINNRLLVKIFALLTAVSGGIMIWKSF